LKGSPTESEAKTTGNYRTDREKAISGALKSYVDPSEYDKYNAFSYDDFAGKYDDYYNRHYASYAISEMLVEKGYTTIYSGWNQCEDIAIASDGKITAGFWNSSKDVFRPVMYLCDPSIYEVDSDKCVYYLRKDNKDIALKKAADKGVTMTLVAEYPQWGIWLYEASENLMTPDSK
jgi:hypothetical protein